MVGDAAVGNRPSAFAVPIPNTDMMNFTAVFAVRQRAQQLTRGHAGPPGDGARLLSDVVHSSFLPSLTNTPLLSPRAPFFLPFV